jgi:FkbM family methyltransferase
MCPPLHRQISRLRKWRLHEPDFRLAYKVLGSSYGGWAVPEGYLDRKSIAYCVGVGRDITFDLALVNRYGCKVFAFDPTPMAVEFMGSRELPDEITFAPIGLSSHDGMATFYTPQREGFDAFSKVIDPKCGESAEILCETLTLASIMKRLGHDRVDLLKMDIEGFEYEVIDDIISSRELPNCLLLEFHHMLYGIGVQQTYRAVESLLAAGYRIFWVSNLGREYGFIRNMNTATDAANSLEARAVEH